MSTKPSLRSFNLNTLPVLREILRHGGVSKAARSLNISQPALSAVLKQLRTQFDDQLIVRSHGSMRLTPKAEAMLAPLEQALSAVHRLISPGAETTSVPAVVFKIATSDHIMNLLGTPLVQMLMHQGLRVIPHFLGAGGHSAGQLLNGEIDFVIMPRLALIGSHVSGRDQDNLNSELLFSESLVGMGPSDDITLGEDMTVEDYLERPHVSLVLDPSRNISVERAFLAGNSLKQNDVARFSNYVALLEVVASSGCIALVPASFGRAAQRMFGVRLFTPPLNFPELEWTILWHRRNDHDNEFIAFKDLLKISLSGEYRDLGQLS